MVKFVAEVSSNHNKSLERTLKLIDKASEIGCSAIKFQLFKIDQLFAPEILEKSETHRKRKGWELPLEFIPKIAERCRKNKIQFGCTPFYLSAVEELRPYVDFYKIASYEILRLPLLTACAKTGKPVVISSGMATIREIIAGVEVLEKHNCKDITVLHCTSSYPTPANECNLAAIETIRNKVNIRSGKKRIQVGWSDHSNSEAVIYRAVEHWEASMVEFHIDLEGSGDEFYFGHCWLPNRIKSVIENIRLGLMADGDGLKKPVPSELPDRIWRADPFDGLRPFRKIRKTWQPS